MQRLGSQLVFRNGLGVGGHELFNRTLQKAHALAQAAANIAVGKHALHDTLFVYHGNSTQALVSDDKESVLNGGIRQNSGILVALVHNIAHSKEQLATQAAAGMENSELASRKVMLFQQGQGQSIPIG